MPTTTTIIMITKMKIIREHCTSTYERVHVWGARRKKLQKPYRTTYSENNNRIHVTHFFLFRSVCVRIMWKPMRVKLKSRIIYLLANVTLRIIRHSYICMYTNMHIFSFLIISHNINPYTYMHMRANARGGVGERKNGSTNAKIDGSQYKMKHEKWTRKKYAEQM